MIRTVHSIEGRGAPGNLPSSPSEFGVARGEGHVKDRVPSVLGRLKRPGKYGHWDLVRVSDRKLGGCVSEESSVFCS